MNDKLLLHKQSSIYVNPDNVYYVTVDIFDADKMNYNLGFFDDTSTGSASNEGTAGSISNTKLKLKDKIVTMCGLSYRMWLADPWKHYTNILLNEDAGVVKQDGLYLVRLDTMKKFGPGYSGTTEMYSTGNSDRCGRYGIFFGDRLTGNTLWQYQDQMIFQQADVGKQIPVYIGYNPPI